MFAFSLFFLEEEAPSDSFVGCGFKLIISFSTRMDSSKVSSIVSNLDHLTNMATDNGNAEV